MTIAGMTSRMTMANCPQSTTCIFSFWTDRSRRLIKDVHNTGTN